MTFTISDAMKEAYDFAPPDEVYYDTLQVDNDGFSNPILVVNSHKELVVTAGTFLPVQFSFSLPETAGSVRGEMTITVNGVPKAVRAAIRNAASAAAPITVTYRQYLEGEVTPDAQYPVPLSITAIKETHLGLEATAIVPDLAGAYFPRRLMTTTALPGCRT